MTITFTAPPAAPVITTSLQAGGSLTAATTYYYVVLAHGETTDLDSTVFLRATCSIASNEDSETTDASNKTVRIDWPAVPGAVGYSVCRSTVSGLYLGSKRIYDTSYATATTVNNYFIDDGTYNLFNTALAPLTQLTEFPLGIDPTAHGIGTVKIDGGTSGSPITLDDIYADAVSNSWTNWCKSDGLNFSFLANIIINNNETHILFKKANLFIMGGTNFASSHSDSVIQIGEIDSQLKTQKEIYCYLLSPGITGVNVFAENSKTYGLNVIGVDDTVDVPPFFESGIFDNQYLRFNGGAHINDKCRHISNINIGGASNIINNCELSGLWLASHSDGFSLSCLNTVGYQYGYTVDSGRSDRIKFYNAGYQFSGARNADHDHIDCTYIDSDDEDNLPICTWGASGLSAKLNIYRSLILQVTDINRNPVEDVNIDIRDNTNTIADDIDGASLQIQTDADGYVWLEKINITSTTSNTLTDSSKSWSVDEFAGRNVYINETGQLMKVLSNTSDTLTLIEDFLHTPSNGTNAGVKIEIKQALMENTGGAGTGPTYTQTTLYTPHEVLVSKVGYETYKLVLNLKDPINTNITIRRSPFKNRNSMV